MEGRLLRRKARHSAHHRHIERDTQPGAHFGPRARRLQEAIQLNAAADGHVFVRCGNAVGQALLSVKRRDDDEFIGDALGGPFQQDQEMTHQGMLAVVVPPAVNGVDDDRYASHPPGPAPQDAGLAAVGVDDVVTALPRQASEPE